MRTLRFDPSLKLGIDEIDTQHAVLVDLINHTQALLDEGGSADALVSVLNRLSDITIDHFTTEEALMLAAGYPELQQHKKLHDHSVERTFNFDGARLMQDPDAGRELLELLRDWLLAHIAADRDMAQFLKQKGYQ